MWYHIGRGSGGLRPGSSNTNRRCSPLRASGSPRIRFKVSAGIFSKASLVGAKSVNWPSPSSKVLSPDAATAACAGKEKCFLGLLGKIHTPWLCLPWGVETPREVPSERESRPRFCLSLNSTGLGPCSGYTGCFSGVDRCHSMPPLGLYLSSSFHLFFCASWTPIPSNLDQNAIPLGVGPQMNMNLTVMSPNSNSTISSDPF